MCSAPTYMHVHIHMHAHTHARTYAHTCTHTHNVHMYYSVLQFHKLAIQHTNLVSSQLKLWCVTEHLLQYMYTLTQTPMPHTHTTPHPHHIQTMPHIHTTPHQTPHHTHTQNSFLISSLSVINLMLHYILKPPSYSG